MINRYFEHRTRDRRRAIEIEEIKYYIESRVLSLSYALIFFTTGNNSKEIKEYDTSFMI